MTDIWRRRELRWESEKEREGGQERQIPGEQRDTNSIERTRGEEEIK